MTTRRKIIPKVYATESVLLDPLNVGSGISYVVASRRRFWGEVAISDCTRKITWDFSPDKESVQKIDKALEMLQNFRTAFVTAMNAYKKSQRKPRRKPKPAQVTIPARPGRGQKYLLGKRTA